MSNNILKKKYSKDDLVSSATNVFRYILKMDDNVLEKHKRYLLDKMLWIYTEAGGKHDTTYQSENAIQKKKKLKETGEYISKNLAKYLRHEHVYPKKGLIDDLLAKPKRVDEILKKAIACVVTKEEHTRLHEINKKFDGWDRYKQAHIKVWNTKKKEWKIDTSDFLLPDNKKENGI